MDGLEIRHHGKGSPLLDLPAEHPDGQSLPVAKPNGPCRKVDNSAHVSRVELLLSE